MKRMLIGLLAVSTVIAGTIVRPAPSEAHPAVIPIVIAAVVGGLVVGAVAANAAERSAVVRTGAVSVGPDRPLACHYVSQRTRRGVQRVQVCD